MTAAELIDAAALPEDAGALAQPDMQGNAFIDALSRSGRQPDGIRALAHALPARDAIAWAADCLRGAASPDKPAEIAAPGPSSLATRYMGQPCGFCQSTK